MRPPTNCLLLFSDEQDGENRKSSPNGQNQKGNLLRLPLIALSFAAAVLTVVDEHG